MKEAPNKKRFSIVPEELMELAKGDESSLNNFIAKDNNDNKIVVRITAEDVVGLLPHLETFNFEVIASSPENNFVEGAIPARRIPGLRTLENEGILGVLPVYKPITNVGAITSQADFVHESDRVREALPEAYDGTGVTVGIMSDSYDNLGGAAGDIASGDLPADGVNVLQDLPDNDGSDEGRGMAQLIHDLAPGADLAFSSVFISEADFAQQIRDLADPTKGDADVLVDDIIYFAEPFFQDGIIAQAVDDVVTNEGVTYFSSAGNSADKAFESDTVNFVADAALDEQIGFTNSYTYYDFDTSGAIDTSQSITLDPNQKILLSFQWDDPFNAVDGVDTDLDLYLLDFNGNYVASAESDNVRSQSPNEILLFVNGGTTQTFEFVILNYSGP
ncbi:MAG: peptidase S8, partial [Pleurocapsa sp.]